MSFIKKVKYLNILLLTLILGVGLFLPFYGLILIGVAFLLQSQKIIHFTKEEMGLLWAVLILMTGYYLVNLIYTLKNLPSTEEVSALFLFIF